MIDLYSGTPGSGKSLYATYELISYLKLGRGVIANFDINQDYFKRRSVKFTYRDNSELTVPFLVQYSKENHVPNREHQTLVIIDEAGMIFNARDWDAKKRMEWIKFFTLHRKLGYDFILISQFDRMIDKQIRALIETEYKFRNIKNYKTFGWILSLLFGGLFVRVGYWYGCRLRISSDLFTFHKKKAEIYDTYKVFE